MRARDSLKLAGLDKRCFQGIAQVTIWHESFQKFLKEEHRGYQTKERIWETTTMPWPHSLNMVKVHNENKKVNDGVKNERFQKVWER